jgi:hypothetical protein
VAFDFNKNLVEREDFQMPTIDAKLHRRLIAKFGPTVDLRTNPGVIPELFAELSKTFKSLAVRSYDKGYSKGYDKENYVRHYNRYDKTYDKQSYVKYQKGYDKESYVRSYTRKEYSKKSKGQYAVSPGNAITPELDRLIVQKMRARAATRS